MGAVSSTGLDSLAGIVFRRISPLFALSRTSLQCNAGYIIEKFLSETLPACKDWLKLTRLRTEKLSDLYFGYVHLLDWKKTNQDHGKFSQTISESGKKEWWPTARHRS